LTGLVEVSSTSSSNLYLHQQAIDTTTPSGKAMFQMCGVFAEFERAMIVERVNSGLARAKAKGVLRLYKGGTGKVKIGRTLGIGTGLVQQVLTEQPRPFDVGASA
jgi:DNA invertase Pin-like site-specific DNA recombinase